MFFLRVLFFLIVIGTTIKNCNAGCCKCCRKRNTGTNNNDTNKEVVRRDKKNTIPAEINTTALTEFNTLHSSAALAESISKVDITNYEDSTINLNIKNNMIPDINSDIVSPNVNSSKVINENNIYNHQISSFVHSLGNQINNNNNNNIPKNEYSNHQISSSANSAKNTNLEVNNINYLNNINSNNNNNYNPQNNNNTKNNYKKAHKNININYTNQNNNISLSNIHNNIKNCVIPVGFYNLNNQNPNQYDVTTETTQKKITEPLKSYIYQPLIGLNNIGSTCFKNSVLQCLSQTRDLTNYFLKETNINAIYNNNIAKKNKNALQLCPVYHELIKNLWDKNGRTSFSPDKFMKVIDDMSKNDALAFKKGEAGDAKDFIIFILEQFHKELQKSVKKNNNQPTTPLNQYDKNNCFNHFIEDFKENCSIISDIFFGFNESNTICLNCKQNYNSKGLNNPICYNYGIFNVLIFPLEEVKNMKMQQMQNNFIQMNINSVNLMECFSYNQKTDYFTEQNQNYCNLCTQLSDAIYVNKIFSSPKYLILIMNRGKNNVFKIKLDFSEMLDLTQFVIQKDKPQMLYKLYGVITHIGESGPSAHFVASCKSPIDNKWYRYNDAIVTPITNYYDEVYNFGTPYILFYEKVQ